VLADNAGSMGEITIVGPDETGPVPLPEALRERLRQSTLKTQSRGNRSGCATFDR